MASKKVPQNDAGRNGDDSSFDFGANATETPASTVEQGSPQTTADAGFSRQALRLQTNYQAALGLQKHVHTIPVDKPPPEAWFRVHPDKTEAGEDMAFDTYLLHIKNGPDRGVYQVPKPLLPLLARERLLKPTRLVVV